MTTLHREAIQAALLRKPKREGMSTIEKWFWAFALAVGLVVAMLLAGSARGADTNLFLNLTVADGMTTNYIQKVIPAVLRWTVVTNWTDTPYTSTTALAWTGDKDPNITTHFEQGIVRSNLVAFVEWKGVTNSVVIESVYMGMLQRSYTLQTETKRIYR